MLSQTRTNIETINEKTHTPTTQLEMPHTFHTQTDTNCIAANPVAAFSDNAILLAQFATAAVRDGHQDVPCSEASSPN